MASELTLAVAVWKGRNPEGAQGRLPVAFARLHLTIAGVVLLITAASGWGAARWIGSRTLYLMVYAAFAAMALGWFVARRRLAVQVDRSDLPARMRQGQRVEVALRITGRRRASTIILEERLHPSLARPVRMPVASIGAAAELEHRYELAPTRRGIYSVGPTVATWSDPFGLTTHRQELAPATTLIVHPSTEAVSDRVLTRMWEDPPVRPPVSKPWPTGFEFYGMRDYVPGDDLRRVVWSAVAKTGRMLVRESEQGITDRVMIALDTDRQWHSPGEPSETFELAVGVAASLGTRHLKDGFSVTVTTNDTSLGKGLRGARARTLLLDELARVARSGTPLRSIGNDLIAEARLGAHFVIVTPHVDKDMTSTLRLVLERGASVVVAKPVWDESDPQSLARAMSVDCQVVQIPVRTSIGGAFAHHLGGGMRR